MSYIDKSIIECFNCHKLGYFQWECQRKESNYVETQDDMLLMVYSEGVSTTKRDTWFLDFGCSNHMCGKKDYFIDFDDNYKNNVKLDNGSSLAVIGQLQENGLSFVFKHEQCKVYHPERVLIKQIKMSSNQMYMFDAICQPIKSTCFTTITRTWCNFGIVDMGT